MAGGPIYPSSAFVVTAGDAFPMIYVGGGSTQDSTEMLGVADGTEVAGDGILWHLVFQMPPALPTGTGKLRILARVNASTGVTGLNIQWVSVDPGVVAEESPDDATMNDELSVDIDWAVGSYVADEYRETLLTLNADTLKAKEMVHMNVEVDDSAHTVASSTGLLLSIIWE